MKRFCFFFIVIIPFMSWADWCETVFSSSLLVAESPQPVMLNLNHTYAHPLLEEARRRHLYEDFKPLSDFRPTEVTPHEVPKEIDDQNLKWLIDSSFQTGTELIDFENHLNRPRWRIAGNSLSAQVIDHIENKWRYLVKLTPPHSTGSLIPLPYPKAVPSERFSEAYYWDLYIANEAFLKTGRLELATMQVENILYLIDQYGVGPNGARTYYLTRAQVPMITTMVRRVAEEHLKAGVDPRKVALWLKQRALPLLERDYQFWMNPMTRYDSLTGLNHHWDALNVRRPERYGADKEELLAKSFRDVRAEAETGKDFTDAFLGEATLVATITLNSVLYRAEKDMAWMYGFIGQLVEQKKYLQKATWRKEAVNKKLWDPQAGVYRDWHFIKGRLPFLTMDSFMPLWAGLASPEQASRLLNHLQRLEAPWGVAMSDIFDSEKQWDGWSTFPNMLYKLTQGLKNYGFTEDTQRIQRKFLAAIERIFAKHGAIFERIDPLRGDVPKTHGEKYEVQEGFLWTNAVYLLMFLDIYQVPLEQR